MMVDTPRGSSSELLHHVNLLSIAMNILITILYFTLFSAPRLAIFGVKLIILGSFSQVVLALVPLLLLLLLLQALALPIP